MVRGNPAEPVARCGIAARARDVPLREFYRRLRPLSRVTARPSRARRSSASCRRRRTPRARGCSAALEARFPVRFEARDAGEWRGLDALVRVGARRPPSRRAGRASTLLPTSAAGGEPRGVRPAGARGRARRTAGRARADRRRRAAEAGPLRAERAGRARGPPRRRRALGPRRRRRERVAMAPCELASQEALRHRLVPGRCLGLLALVHFLRGVCCGCSLVAAAAARRVHPRRPQPALAHVRPRRLRRAGGARPRARLPRRPGDDAARRAGSRIPRAGRVCRRAPDRVLSLPSTATTHTVRELGRPRDADAATALRPQALRRVAAFERRAGRARSRA